MASQFELDANEEQNEMNNAHIGSNLYLLKLQSILCSSYITTDQCQLVLDKMAASTKSHDREPNSNHQTKFIPIELLCEAKLSPSKSIERVVKSYPNVMLSFMRETFEPGHKYWGTFMSCLFETIEMMEQTDGNSVAYTNYKQSLSEVLSYLVENLPAKDFLSLLPQNGSMGYFGEYIERSMKRHQALELGKSMTVV